MKGEFIKKRKLADEHQTAHVKKESGEDYQKKPLSKGRHHKLTCEPCNEALAKKVLKLLLMKKKKPLVEDAVKTGQRR